MSEEIIKKKKNFSYLRQVKDEFKKISWTSKKELFLSTRVVLISTILFGIAIYVADIFIRNLLNGFDTIVKLIFG